MSDIDKFQSLLGKLMEKARNNGDKIDGKTISEIFADMKLNDIQYKQIKDYLALNRIEVEGYERKAEDTVPKAPESSVGQKYMPKEINSKDSAYLEQYLDEIKDIKESSEQEEYKLLQKIKSGDSAAKSRFIEINLRKVLEIAGGYRNMGMTAEDLIQEGNFALIQSIDELPETDDINRIREYIRGKVQNGIESALKDQQDNDNFENILLERGNRIYQALKVLEEESGHKADIHELAEYMELSEEEIEEILGLSADSVKLQEHSHGED